jgi:hypothetical protein
MVESLPQHAQDVIGLLEKPDCAVWNLRNPVASIDGETRTTARTDGRSTPVRTPV